MAGRFGSVLATNHLEASAVNSSATSRTTLFGTIPLARGNRLDSSRPACRVVDGERLLRDFETLVGFFRRGLLVAIRSFEQKKGIVRRGEHKRALRMDHILAHRRLCSSATTWSFDVEGATQSPRTKDLRIMRQ